MPRRTFAAFDLKAARTKHSLSQQAVAEILCAAQSSVARWEVQGNMPEVFRKVWQLHWELDAIKTRMASGAPGSLVKIARKHAKETKLKGNIRANKVEEIGAVDTKIQASSNSRVLGRRRRPARHPAVENGATTEVAGVEPTSSEDAGS